MPQQQFSLNNHPCVIASFNPRSEKHGDENVPAGDIKLSTRVHSSVLDQFDPSYRSFLFRKADHEGEQQALLEGDTLTSLAKPKLAPLSLKEDWPGYRLVIGSGLDLGHPLVLTDVELSNFKIEAMEGGSVALSFSATAHPDADAAGALCQAIQDTVDVTLEPPTKPDGQMPLGGEGDTLDQQDAADPAAEEE